MLGNISHKNEKCAFNFNTNDGYCSYDEAVLNEKGTCTHQSLIADSREIPLDMDNLNPSEFVNE